MKKESMKVLGRREAERWIMERSRSGREAASQERAILDVIQVMARHLARQQEQGADSVEGSGWLLDNLYLLRCVGESGIRAFRGAKNLPALSAPKGCLRVQWLANRILNELELLDALSILDYLRGVQEICVLREEELNLLVPALELELLDQIARSSRIMVKRKGEPAAWEGAGSEVIAGITRLHQLNGMELGQELESLCRVDQILRQDPAGVYPRMDAESRWRYRQQVSRLAKKPGSTLEKSAQQTIAAAQAQEEELGKLLFPRKKSSSGGWYVAAILFPSLALALWISFWLGSWWGGLLLFLPLTEVLKNGVDFVAVRVVPPRYLFRLELEEGVPEEGKSLCVITSLLTEKASGAALAKKLERYCLANRQAGKNLLFGILADLPDGENPMSTSQRQWVDEAEEAVAELNERYGGGFFLFFRKPVYLTEEGRYMGRERKRGALLELARFLRAVPSGLKLLEGERKVLQGTRYVVTLDSDTALNINAASRMIGTMLHPMNQPQIDPKRKVVSEGYGMLQPRTAVSLSDTRKTRFARVMAGLGGTEPYGCLASGVYHDLFDRGSFTGKGIFDVAAFHTCLENRFPENQVLSMTCWRVPISMWAV